MARTSDTGKVGRPRTGWTQVGVKVAPDLLAKIDAWRGGQTDLPARPEAVRRLVTVALSGDQQIAPPPAANFGNRDRVRSHIYGIGTVMGPVADRSSSPLFDGVATTGLAATVRWDNTAWGITEVAVEGLEHAASEDQRRPG